MPILSTPVILLLTGLAAGILAGLFGIGGGVIIVPSLVLLLGFTQHKATGTSLAVLLPPIGIAAVMEYYRHGDVDLKAALIIAAAAILGGYIGAVLAGKMSGPALRLTFGVFVTGMGVYLILSALRKLGRL